MIPAIRSLSRNGILLALLVAAPLSLLATAQMPLHPTPIGGGGYPLLPGDIVNLSGSASPGAFGGFTTVYTVPAGKWLILTDLEINQLAPPNNIDVDLAEFTGSTVVKRSGSFNHPLFAPYHSTVGFAFHPGSQVRFINNSGMAGSVDYSITGRLSSP